jgi:type VI secretion system protein ImpG
LRIADGESVEDPHVSRLVESFALLTARLRLKLEDEFPEIWQSLLSALYPQYLIPIPSFSICEMKPLEASAVNPVGVQISRGARMEVDTKNGEQCYFRTCFDTAVYPIKIAAVEYLEPPFPFEMDRQWRFDIRSAIRVRIETLSDKIALSQIKLSNLRLFLGENDTLGNLLYEYIFRESLSIGLLSGSKVVPTFLKPQSVLKPVGFAAGEALLDRDPRTRDAYRLLWEFFSYPKKFRFIDVDLSSCWTGLGEQCSADLVFYLRNKNERLQREVRTDSIRLGCTPVVNLFSQPAESVFLTDHQVEFQVVPASSHLDKEVISIDEVTTRSLDGSEQVKYEPFFMPNHDIESGKEQRYWHASRRRVLAVDEDHDLGTEVFLTLVDLQGRNSAEKDWTLHVRTTCCNRDLVTQVMDITEKGPVAKLRDVSGGVKAQLISTPTPTRRPGKPEEYYWRLISHLNLNHLSIVDNDDGAESLKEILRLYNFSEGAEAKRAIQGIGGVRYERSVARVASDQGVQLCRGLDIELRVEGDKLTGVGGYLFSTVLEHVLSVLSTINSFTRLTVRSIDQEKDQEPLFKGRPRLGERVLL